MRSDWIISGVGHAAILAFGLVSLASSKPTEVLSDFMPVTIVTDADISRATAGQKNAPMAEEPKPLVDKVGDPKPVKQLAPKAADKPEVTTDSAPLPQPKPEAKAEATPKPKTPDIKPDKVAQQPKKDEGKKAKPEKKQPQFNPDLIAQELKKDEAKTPPTPKEQRPSPKFDADQVAALLDKREPQRQLAFGDTLNNAAALGTANGHAAQLSQSELDALRARLVQCWSPPPGVDPGSKLYVMLHVTFRPDGSLAQEPQVVEDAAASLGPALAESAKRALRLCQPFTMLKPEHYDLWKDIDIKFNNELLGG